MQRRPENSLEAPKEPLRSRETEQHIVDQASLSFLRRPSLVNDCIMYRKDVYSPRMYLAGCSREVCPALFFSVTEADSTDSSPTKAIFSGSLTQTLTELLDNPLTPFIT